MDAKTTAALNQVAGALDIPPAWLDAVIAFESNWKPQQRAYVPYNQYLVTKRNAPPKYAKGLIQFTDETAQTLGFKDSADLIAQYPTADKQLLTPVYNYFKKYKPFPTKQSLYMAVFYPIARTWPLETVLPDSVRASNPNINTVGDYVNFVEKKSLKKKAVISAGAIAALVVIVF